MAHIHTFNDLKGMLQAGFEDNVESMRAFGISRFTQLKGFLIESNRHITELPPPSPYGSWRKLDSSEWYINDGGESPETLLIDTSRDRVWVLYSLLGANESNIVISKWMTDNIGLDRCWLSRNQLMHYHKKESWKEKGVGLRFIDGLTPEINQGNFSLKAWYGASRKLEGLDEIIGQAKEKFAIYSTRWQKINNGTVAISTEWYSNGKVTINRALDVDEALISVSYMANRYEDALLDATKLRDNKMGAFELEFTQDIDLKSFSDTVSMGKGIMNLWLVETESKKDFKRFRGVDLHTWDRILMDVGEKYAYITIPGKGCVNAAPRIATLQGEDNAGKTSIYFDGVEVFG
jgi:hypothetical protein